MKTRILSVCLALFTVVFQGMAQKYLNVYQDNVVIKRIPSSDIDSIRVTDSNPRTVEMWRNGSVFLSYAAEEIDSIKVARVDEPMSYIGIVGFNDELYKKDIGVLATSTSSLYKSFVNSLPQKDGTLLYYAVDNALDMLENNDFKTPLKSVNFITFTDGLDLGSTMMSDTYWTARDYLNAMSSRIRETQIQELPINAYTVGLRGQDVTDVEMFRKNLVSLASTEENAFEVNSIYDLRSRLQDIANRIISISNRQTISVKVPGIDHGSRMRFIFDGQSVENSQFYIEGTFSMQDRSLHDVTYHGMRARSGSLVQGTQSGIFLTFTFTGLQRLDGNGLIPMNYITHYYRMPSSSTWQKNSEFQPDNNTQRTVTYTGTSIFLVLDCSSSLGGDFSRMKSYANEFIDMVAGNALPVFVDTPQNVTASISESDEKLAVRLEWDRVRFAESYDIYRSKNNKSGSFSLIASDVTSTSFVDETPLDGNNYYQIVANGYGLTSSRPANVYIYVSLDKPQNVRASLDDNSFVINVSWNAVKYAESYNVYRNGSLVAEGITATHWTDESPRSGTNYYYVEAVGNGLVSAHSENSDNVDYVLGVPQNVKAALDDNDFVINVSWDAVKYTEYYKVYRSSSSSGSFSLVADNITTPLWQDTTPLKGNNYYRIYAVSHDVTSSSSSTSNGVKPELQAPQNVISVKGEGKFTVNVSWDAVKYVEFYKVYRSNTSTGTFNLMADNVTTNAWTDESIGYGPRYYKVCAVGHGLTSEMSEASEKVFIYNENSTTITVNGVSFVMIKVEGGTFQMGSTTGDSNERPVHQVTLTNDYYIGETEVTQELWKAVMGNNPSSFKGSDQLPVERVFWNDCQTFITKLNELTGKTFRLPTEAEWEFAARGGNASQGYTYSGSNTVGDVAWYNVYQTIKVATKAPNELGIYDMSGNVWEWCQDWYRSSYSSSAQTNPTGPTSGSYRVKRGGSWHLSGLDCRVSSRSYSAPSYTNGTIGLRLVL
jgi:formylglycine-generating enzyme required for sulfatase activity